MSLASRLAFHCNPDFPFRCLRGSSTPCDAAHTRSYFCSGLNHRKRSDLRRRIDERPVRHKPDLSAGM